MHSKNVIEKLLSRLFYSKFKIEKYKFSLLLYTGVFIYIYIYTG